MIAMPTNSIAVPMIWTTHSRSTPIPPDLAVFALGVSRLMGFETRSEWCGAEEGSGHRVPSIMLLQASASGELVLERQRRPAHQGGGFVRKVIIDGNSLTPERGG